MRPVVVVSLLLVSGGSLGCAQTWGLGDRPPASVAPTDAPPPSDPEIERLEALADRLEQALGEVNEQLDAAEARWGEADTAAVKSSLAGEQDRLERRLVLSVAIANVRAAITSRRAALEEGDGTTPLPESEPLPAELDDVIRQATEQVRAARDRRDARGGEVDGATSRRPEPVFSLPSGVAGEDAAKKKSRKAAAVVGPPPARADLEQALVPHYDALNACVPKSAGVSRVIVRGRLTEDGHLRELRVSRA